MTPGSLLSDTAGSIAPRRVVIVGLLSQRDIYMLTMDRSADHALASLRASRSSAWAMTSKS